MDTVNLLGLSAGTLTTLAFVPQVWRTWRSRSTKDISAGMFVLFSIGVFLWLLYGIALGAVPVIIANCITLALALAVLWMKFRFK
jgi:MtN3 and saliva related transmembrane protein